MSVLYEGITLQMYKTIKDQDNQSTMMLNVTFYQRLTNKRKRFPKDKIVLESKETFCGRVKNCELSWNKRIPLCL